MKANKPITVEDQIALMRKGNDQDLKLKQGELEIPCRLMSANEEGQAIANAKTRVKVPIESQRAYAEGTEIQKCVLEAACTVSSTPYASRKFLDSITSAELENLYDQYISLLRVVNPRFENLTSDQVGALISDVTEKKRASSELFTWQLAEIGRFFLDQVLPRAKGAGSL